MEYVLGALLLIFFAVAVGKLCGRVLGVRLGNVRGIITGIAGWVGGVAAAVFTLAAQKGDGWTLTIHTFGGWLAFVVLTILFGTLAAMPVAIGLDLLTRDGPPRSRRRRRRMLLHPVKTTQKAFAPYGRLREVAASARRANLLHLRYASRSALDSPDMSNRLRVVIEDSGGMLIKFGQIASTRDDILPDALITELAKLRADVRPVPAADVRTMLESELGEPAEQAFASFEWEPLAAASIGQTHRATLHDGTRVVVKVQRPGIAELVSRDASVLRLAARQLERRVEAARAVNLRSLANELIGGVEAELNYLNEAKAGMQLRDRRAADVGIAIPKVYPTLTTERILVMEEAIARSISDPHALGESPVSRVDIARRVLSSFLGQIIEDGVFHADPHPGNMLIDEAGTVWLIDFGSVGRLEAVERDAMRGIVLGVATNDPGLLARAARDLAGSPGAIDLRTLELDLSGSLSQLEGGGIDPRLIGQILGVMKRHEMHVPPSMTLLARALLTLEGTLKQLEPTFSLGNESKAVALRDRDEVFGSPEELLQKEVLRALPSLRTLPEHAETLANQLRAGRLTVRVDRYAGGDRQVVDNWVDRSVIAAVGGFGVVASALLLFAAASTESNRVQFALWILGFFGLAAGSVLLMRSAARALRRTSGRID